MGQAGADGRSRKPLLRRASDRTPIGRIVGPMEYAFGTGDHVWAAELLERNPIVAWYGMAPDRFAEIVSTLLDEGIPCGAFVQTMSGLLSLGAAGAAEATEVSAAETAAPGPDAVPSAFDLSPAAASLAGRVFALRMAGRPVEALDAAAQLTERFGAIQPIFDDSLGWDLFSAVQHGITAMLAGDFSSALTSFTRARMLARVPALAFLTRDAYVKTALIEAAYGDREQARAMLESAARIPRTESWAEDVVDASRSIAEALIDTSDPEGALRRLDTLPLPDVGEMWPFYVTAVQRTLALLGDANGAKSRLKLFCSLPLARVDGQGYTGSALSYSGVMGAIRTGDLAEARELLETADAAAPLTGLLGALLELASGRPRKALRQASAVREHTQGLRMLEVWRLAIVAGSLFDLGAEEDCRDVLEFAVTRAGGLRPYEADQFSARVRAFARANLEDWPGETPEAGRSGAELFPPLGGTLTSRELDVLRELASGRSREQIASSQFISLNTLKAHLRSIYRKLDVRSRTAAVIEAERRGLV